MVSVTIVAQLAQLPQILHPLVLIAILHALPVLNIHPNVLPVNHAVDHSSTSNAFLHAQ